MLILGLGNTLQKAAVRLRSSCAQRRWRSIFRTFPVVAAALVAVPPTALAAAPGTCNTYVAEAVAAAADVRQLDCGYDLNHPQWGTDPGAHARWCRDHD